MLSKKAITSMQAVVIIAIILIAAIAGVVYWYTLPQPSPSPTGTPTPTPTGPIKIGLPQPMSGSGGYVGEYALDGIKLAAEEINDAGGLLGGRKITLIIEDHRGIPAEGVAAVNKLMVDHDVSAMIGGMFSSVSLAIVPEVEKGETPLLEISSTAPALRATYGKKGSYYFRVNPDNLMEAELFGEALVKDLGYENIYFMMEDSDWGRGAAEAFQGEIEKAGGTIVGTEYFPIAEVNFMPILTKIQELDPDAVLSAIKVTEGINFYRQRHELGLTVPFVNLDSLASTDFIEGVTPEVAEGLLAIVGWAMTLPSPENQEFLAKYRERYNRDPIEFSAYGYTAMYCLASAIEIAGSDDPKAIRDALEQVDIKPGSTYGFLAEITGPIKFDDQNQAHPNDYMVEITGGTIEQLGVWQT